MSVWRLVKAAEQGDLKALQEELDKGLDADSMDEEYGTALTAAARCQHFEAVKLLVEHKATVDKPNHAGVTALFYACGHVQITAFLLDNKADINKLSTGGWTPLINAAYAAQEAGVRLLLQWQADTSIKNSYGLTALDAAVQKRHNRVVALLAAWDLLPSVKLMIEQKGPSNIDEFGNNELHACASWFNGEQEALQLLLHCDVNASLLNNERKTPTAIARERQQEKLALLLATAETFQALPTVQLSELEMQKKLSEGAFGEAWLAQWHRSAVVVKTLKRKPESWTAQNFIEFANEAAASERVSKHSNIVPFVGVCKRMPTFAMVYQFMTRGSLEDLLIKSDKPQSLQTIVTFAIEAATGLAHLHANQPEPMLHCDFALRNLLLDGAGVVRVSDFGLAMKAPKSDEAKDTQKPVAWSAPEALSGQFSTKSDVFSFGVVMWEMIARKSPHQFWLGGLSKVLGKQATVNDIGEAVQSGLRLPLPNGTPAELVELVNDCWQAEASARPEMVPIVDRLKAFRESLGAESKDQSQDLQVAVARIALLENERAQLLESLQDAVSLAPAAAVEQVRAVVAAALADGRIQAAADAKSADEQLQAAFKKLAPHCSLQTLRDLIASATRALESPSAATAAIATQPYSDSTAAKNE